MGAVISADENMYKVILKDRTKAGEFEMYYLEDVKKLTNLWEENEQNVVHEVTEADLKIGAKQDFTLEKSTLTLHNTKGYESKYYVANLLVKVRWAVCDCTYIKLASFVATGICKENVYGDGSFEQVTCCGNPVLHHYSSSIVPQVSDFEEEFSKEKITMLGYKLLQEFETLEEVNADIAKKCLTDAEVECLLHDIPGELG